MRTSILAVVIGCFITSLLQAQNETVKNYRNLPVVITLQFHSLSLPFQDLKTNFSNMGISLGTEISHNGRHNWVQQFNAGWYRNKAIGNGLMFFTQTAWRPTIASGMYTEAKASAGYLYSFRPAESYQQVDGNWEPVGKKGKGMLMVPVGISAGYNPYTTLTYMSPFVSYQFLLVRGYNRSIPDVSQTLLQLGSRIHP